METEITKMTDRNGDIITVEAMSNNRVISLSHGDDVVFIEEELLMDTIMTLTAILNARKYKLPVRPLHAVFRGAFHGCLVMENVLPEEDNVHRSVDVVYAPDTIRLDVGLQFILRRDSYMPYEPCAASPEILELKKQRLSAQSIATLT